MRIPNMSKVSHDTVDEQQHEVKKIKDYYPYESMGYDLSEEKNKAAFVKYIKTIVRGSIEYKEMVDFLKKHIDMNHCSYFKKVNNSIKGINLEIHHEPFVLEDIVYIVIRYFLDNDLPIDPAVISEQVMLLHYQGLIGLMPVTKTVHELIHAKQIFVPITHVYGDVETFVKQYWDYMTDEQKDILAKSVKLAKKLSELPPKVLKKKFIYLDVDGMSLPQKVKSNKEK